MNAIIRGFLAGVLLALCIAGSFVGAVLVGSL